MITKTNVENKESVVEKCNSTHLVVCFLHAEKFYAPPGGHDYNFTLFAKCPITGAVYHEKDSNNIKGKILHYIDDQEIDYKLKKCSISDWYAKYESWDTVANTIANSYGIKDLNIIKDMIRLTFPSAKFESDILENSKVKRKTLCNSFAK